MTPWIWVLLEELRLPSLGVDLSKPLYVCVSVYKGISSYIIYSIKIKLSNDLKYLDSHEWVKVEGNSATVGITDHAQDHLGDVVYIELPEVGAPVSQGDSFGVVESVKATNDINSPISGKVVEVNEELNDSPGLVIKALHTKWHQANCQANL
ncbi:glycine cleavage system H protein 2, mitochondrial-like isoform X1 [Quercus robur]|uniref:glycine cleavage system H protein 2, mitochondrial-like isoform X1 n=1 Tax=Quercus robur TaxID=38942 RepID=UPI002161D385|nr:glycine cleavage system H protein 2, mitochondrial-like isoform X1 [Quercus robur]